MAELNIGKHCSVPTCHQLDFLPFMCYDCSKIFCKLHKEVTAHQCSGQPSTLPKISSVAIVSYQCTFNNCENTELVPVKCSLCEEQFCLTHRSAEVHNCTKLNNQRNPKLVENPSSEPTYTVPKKIKYKNKKQEKLATKVALMKLKMSAKGKATIPTNHRVYFLIYKASDDTNHPVFVSKDWTVGRVLDVVADALKSVNKNHLPNEPHLHLFSASTGTVLQNNKVVDDLLKTESVFNGSTIVLAYV